MATAFRLELVGDNTSVTPARADIWLSAQEIAAHALPGLPRDKRKVNERAREERWAFRVGADGLALARPRKGRGGGIEYHVDVIPAAARATLLGGATPISNCCEQQDRTSTSLWTWFELQSTKVKDEARRRLRVLDAVARFETGGVTRTTAVAAASAAEGVSTATLWNWLQLVAGIDTADHLPALAPKRSGGGKAVAIDDELFRLICSDYLRPEGPPTWESCYRRLVRNHCAPAGLKPPSSRTLYRRFEREIDPLVIVKRRFGREAHERTLPSQIRSVAGLHALEVVNIDGHRWDVFVRWYDGRVLRPMMVAIQDVYSGKLLGWRIDESENTVSTRLAFADVFRDFGIPKACLLDNSRTFASKIITGGAKTRFRFKIKPEEPTGLLPALGINPKWATPYHGQAKPIERMFRNLCDSIATCPDFAGAYSGNRPDAKPENYGSKAVPIEDFIEVLRREFGAYNAQTGRRGDVMAGRTPDQSSFDVVFNESYAVAPIGKASPEQLRLAKLAAADAILTDRRTGAISVHGNRYWSEQLAFIAGERVTVRFDPEDLHSVIHVYRATGEYLCDAPVWEKTGFADVEAAQRLGRRKSEWRKRTKKAEESLDLLRAEELAELYRRAGVEEAEIPEPSVIRPVRARGNAVMKEAPEAPLSGPEKGSERAPFIDRFAAAAERHLRIVE